MASKAKVYQLFLKDALAHTQAYDWIIYSSLDVVHVKLPKLDRLEPGYMYLPDLPVDTTPANNGFSPLGGGWWQGIVWRD